MDKEKLLKTAITRFAQAQQAEKDNRKLALKDIEFANGEQWDKKTKQERVGRPSLVINKVGGILKTIRGNQRQAKPEIKVLPVDNGADPELANILNGLIKNIEYNSDSEVAYDTAFEQAIEGGWGYFRVDTEYTDDDVFEQDIKINRITNPFSVFLDPSYTKIDGSDAKWAFVSKVYSREDFKAKYPDIDVSGWEAAEGEEHSDWFTDDGVRVAEYWYRKPCTKHLYQLESGDVMTQEMVESGGMELKQVADGEILVRYGDEVAENGQRVPEVAYIVKNKRAVESYDLMYCKLAAGEVLEAPVKRPGKYIPICIVVGEESFVAGERTLKSAHRAARDPQKVYNWMVSTAVETVSMAPKQPFMVTPEQIEGHENQWNTAHQKPMPYLLYNNVPGLNVPNRQSGSFPDSGATQERMGASDDIKSTTGIYDASLGAQSNETSGIAIQRREAQGDMSTYVFIDNLRRAVTHCGRILVDLIPHIYDSERIIRILAPDGTEEFIPINKTMTDKITGKKQTINDVTQGKYDVVVTVGAAYNTQREEAAANMLQLIQNMPQIAPHIIDLVVKHMDWVGADEIYERLKKLQTPDQGQQEQDPRDVMDLEKKKLDIQGKKISNTKGVQDLLNQIADNRSNDPADKKAEQEVIKALQGLLGETPQENA